MRHYGFEKVSFFDDEEKKSAPKKKYLFCSGCGCKINTGIRFCPKCGKKTSDSAPVLNKTIRKKTIDSAPVLNKTIRKKIPDAETIAKMKKKLNGKWGRIKIDKLESVSIGRDPNCDIHIKDVRIMLYHAFFRKNMNKWYIYDSSLSRNIFLNRTRVNNRAELFPGDFIQLFDTQIIFFGDEIAYCINNKSGQHLNIQIEKKTVRSTSFPYAKKELIKDINIFVPSGEFVLILGGSGAGKTTFMNAVLGLRKAKGKILLNGLDLYKNFNQMKYKIGYVPQFSLVRSNETVENAIIDAARIKLPSDISDAELHERVNKVISMLALEPHKTNLFSKLSGGQKKRVCVAIEAVIDPSLFFLDEPDSGLDGVNSRHLMEILHKLALQDKIVMTITHAPNNAQDLFTKVVVLAKSKKDGSGHLAFYGSVEESLRFFEVDNLQDIILRINPHDEGGEDRADEFIQKFSAKRRGRI